MKWLLILVLALAAAPPAAAQTRADTAAVLLDGARRLRAEGQGAAADAVLQLIRRQFAGTPAAEQAGGLLLGRRASPEAERPGRVELLVFGTSYGLWLGGALPFIAESNSPEAYGVGLLLGGPAGFLAARHYLRDRAVSEGQARAITFGGTWGTWQGYGWTEVLDPGREECFEDMCYSSGPSAEARMAGAVVGGLAGIVTGAVLARKPIASGTATATSFGALWGTWYGFALGSLADAEDDDLLAAALVGGDVGLLTVGLLAPRWNPSRSRARLVSLGGVVGLLGGFGIDLLLIDNDEKAAILIPTVTSAVGLGWAAYATRGMDAVDEGGDGGGAGQGLLNRTDGRWALGVPAVALKLERAAGRSGRTSLTVPLLEARF